MKHPSSAHEAWELASQLCNGEIAAEDAARFSEMLRADIELRNWLVDYMNLHAQLMWEHRAAQEVSTSDRWIADEVSQDAVLAELLGDDNSRHGGSGQVTSLEPTPTWLNRRWPRVAAVVGGVSPTMLLSATAAAVVFWGALIIALMPGPRKPHGEPVAHEVAAPNFDSTASQPTVKDRVPALARLTAARDCVWKSSGPFPRVGQLLGNERMVLARGVAEITYPNGVKLIVEGPSEWQLKEPKAAELHVGRIVAMVPPAGIGFAVETLAARIVDLGTEFGVVAETSGRTGVRVFRGTVDVEPRDERFQFATGDRTLNGKQRLATGESTWVASRNEGVREGAAVDASSFKRRLAGTDGEGSPTDDKDHVFVAYVVPPGTHGDQPFAGALGMDFDVLDAIDVHRLGVFDSLGDGFDSATTLVTELWTRDSDQTLFDAADDRPGRVLATVEFTSLAPGELRDGSRFKALAAPIRLEPGSYTIVAVGFSDKDPNGNSVGGDTATANAPWFTSDGHGRLMFVGTARYSPGGRGEFPTQIDGGPANRYAAGTFEYYVCPKTEGANLFQPEERTANP